MRAQAVVLAKYPVAAALANDAITAVALDSRLLDVLAGPRISFRKLMSLVEEVVPGVFSFPGLNPAFAERLLEETARFTAFRSSLSDSDKAVLAHRPKFKNVPLDYLGLQHFQDWLLTTVVTPIAQALYPGFDGATGLDFRHAYIIGYGANASHATPTDPSDAVPSTTEADVSGHVSRVGLDLHTGVGFELLVQ